MGDHSFEWNQKHQDCACQKNYYYVAFKRLKVTDKNT